MQIRANRVNGLVIKLMTYRHMCWRLWMCLNRDTGFVSWTRIGPCSGRRWKKNKYLWKNIFIDYLINFFCLNWVVTVSDSMIKSNELKRSVRLPSAAWALYCIFNEFHDRSRFEFGTRSKWKRTLILFDAYMAYAIVQFECEWKDIMIIRAVANNETSIGFIWQDFFGCFTRNGSPIPPVLLYTKNIVFSLELSFKLEVHVAIEDVDSICGDYYLFNFFNICRKIHCGLHIILFRITIFVGIIRRWNCSCSWIRFICTGRFTGCTTRLGCFSCTSNK